MSTFNLGTTQKTTRQVVIPVLVQHSATLLWAGDSGVTFKIYRSTTSGSGYIMVNLSPVTTKSYQDFTILSGVTYYYVVTAYDPATNLESEYSNEVIAVVPLP